MSGEMGGLSRDRSTYPQIGQTAGVSMERACPTPTIEWTRSLFERTGVFGLAVALCLLPIWAFHYLPTQDGPAHLANAVILKEFGTPGTRYHEFFEVRWEALPNWTLHIMLGALLYAVPPLVAEKIVVTLYVLGFACAFRYFHGAFGEPTAIAPLAALLLVFPRCFWMGFYNYCLSLTLFFLIVGFGLRRLEWTGRDGAWLCLLFLAAWFTHLMGFLLAFAAVGWLVGACSRRVGPVAWTLLAGGPALILSVAYAQRTDLMHVLASPGHLLTMRSPSEVLARLGSAFAALPAELYTTCESAAPLLLGLMLLLLGGLLLLGSPVRCAAQPDASKRWAAGVLGIGIFLAYLLVPDHLPGLHGGFLKCRLAPLPFLIALGMVRRPANLAARRVLGGIVLVAIAGNSALVALHIASLQSDLAEFTAAREQLGTHHVLFVSRRDLPESAVDHLEHAADHYCLEGGNINLDNHAAATEHFPIRFRARVERGRRDFATHPNRSAVDRIIWWARPVEETTPPLRVLFQRKRLALTATQ